MIKGIIDWLDHRAGVRSMVSFLLLEGVPGGARWRYVWGSCLAFVFSIQLITGILLMTAYSPSSSQAWSSVHFIQYQMDFGWLIRGLHHFGSQTMVVLLALHMLQVVIAGAHLPPREVNWWLGIGLLSATLGLSLTGYLLPWDQKGYWATRVATNIASNIPILGDDIKQLAVGGPDYGNHTLTRFYALHVAILPLGLIVLLIAHITIFRRHGVTSRANIDGLVTNPGNEYASGSEEFWPRQAFYDLIACMVVFGVMLSLVLYGFGHEVKTPITDGDTKATMTDYDYWAKAGQRGKGADLDAAADRDTANYPARPEWYFLFLFQLLKYFPGDQILIGTVFIPNGVMLLLTLLPIFGYGPMHKIGHFFGVLVMMTLLILVGLLTLAALRDDRPDGILWGLVKNTDEKDIEKAISHQHAVEDAEVKAKRACQLAMAGTPVDGAHYLIRNDPLTTGRELFSKHCGSCHAYTAREDDVFRRTLPVPLVFETKEKEKFNTVDLFENAAAKNDWKPLRDKLKEKGVALSDKFEVKVEEPGKKWHIVDKDWDRDFHVHHEGTGIRVSTRSMTDGRTASDLGEFGSEAWVRGLLKNSMADKYFGLVKRKDDKGNLEPGLTGMRGWRAGVEERRKEQEWNAEKLAEQEKQFDLIASWLADQRNERDKRNPKIDFDAAQKAFKDKKNNKCATCHTTEFKDKAGEKWVFTSVGGDSAPDLTKYGSADWIRGMIMRPGHKSRYDEKNLMPAFRNLDGPGSEITRQEFRDTYPTVPENMLVHLSDVDRELIIRWMLRDYRPVFGGAGIAK